MADDERAWTLDRMHPQLFRALFDEYSLNTVDGVHIVVPKGTLVFAGASLNAIAGQIDGYETGLNDDRGAGTPPSPGLPVRRRREDR